VFTCQPDFDDRVIVFHVTPGLRAGILDTLVGSDDVRGVVLAAFGSGTVPSAGTPPLVEVVARLVEHGTDVLVVTESAGEVNLGLYRNSRSLSDAGAISGGKMRIEAALTKLMHGLGTYDDVFERRAYLTGDVAGELS
jgi:L-asparaginase